RKKRSRRMSMLDGWSISASHGLIPIRPASSSALMSRSESSTQRTLPSYAPAREPARRFGARGLTLCAYLTMEPMSFKRYVALGASFTEGVGAPDPTRPNGLMGWADRVAHHLASQDPEFTYANLAIRGRKLL